MSIAFAIVGSIVAMTLIVGVRYLAVSGGFAEVGADHVTILAETAERPEEIDLPRARAARERADQRLRLQAGEAVDVGRALAALARADGRIQIAARRVGGT